MSRQSRGGWAEWLLNNSGQVLAAAGGGLYVLVWIALSRVYREYGLSLSELGLGYLEVLGRSMTPAGVFLGSIAIFSALIGMRRWRKTFAELEDAQAELARADRLAEGRSSTGGALEAERLRIEVVRAKASVDSAQQVADRSLAGASRLMSVAAGAFSIWSVLLIATAAGVNTGVATGRLWAPVSGETTRVTVEWVGDPNAAPEPFGNDVMWGDRNDHVWHIASSNGRVYFFEERSEVLFVFDASNVVVASRN